MSSAGFTRPGLLCVLCGEPFTLSRVRPDVSRVEDLSDPFQATCRECDQQAIYRKSDIPIIVPVDGCSMQTRILGTLTHAYSCAGQSGPLR